LRFWIDLLKIDIRKIDPDFEVRTELYVFSRSIVGHLYLVLF